MALEILPSAASPSFWRQQIRDGHWRQHTSGLAEGYVQCNLVILPTRYAFDFLRYCQRNAQACPLIAVGEPGDYRMMSLAADLDIRTDVPSYRLFRHGELETEVTDLLSLWQNDWVTFAIGCSFSFEQALLAAGLEIRNITEAKNVPMYVTNRKTEPAGPFEGPLVVSMRPMLPADAIRAIQICSRFPAVHGAPIHFGEPSALGIGDLARPDYGDAVTIKPGEVPVFWACGVTPQQAIARARPDICITHSPGHMLITDLLNQHMAAF
jgi:uncharacterized protein YcsI (UPF0317 family)